MTTTYLDRLESLSACSGALAWCRAEHPTDFRAAWGECPDGRWMLWLLVRLDRRRGVGVLVEVVRALCAHLAGDEVTVDVLNPLAAWAAGDDTVDVQVVRERAWEIRWATVAAAAARAAAAYAADAAAAAAYAADAAATAAACADASTAARAAAYATASATAAARAAAYATAAAADAAAAAADAYAADAAATTADMIRDLVPAAEVEKMLMGENR